MKKTALLAASAALLLGQQFMAAPIAKADEINPPPETSSRAGTPVVTNSATQEDAQSFDGLQLAPNPADGSDVQYFKITDIVGGTLYENDGTTPISDDSYIPLWKGEAGLKFSPEQDANNPSGDYFSFNVQASKDEQDMSLSDAVRAVITVGEVNDDPVAGDDSLPSVAEGSGEVVIPFADLLINDNSGVDNEGDQTLAITGVANSSGGSVRLDNTNQMVVFTPGLNSSGLVSFEYTITDNGTTGGDPDPKSSTGTASFTILKRSDAPTVTGATTDEDTMSDNRGLKISSTPGSGATTEYYRISSITGGQLFQHDGLTPIQDGEYITASEGMDGLRFLPNANANGDEGFGFLVQASPDQTDKLLSNAVQAAVTVTGVNDEPVIALNGDSTVYLLKGQIYREPGYSAQDLEDGDLTEDVSVTGTVVTNAIGTYSLHYNVADHDDEAAAEAVRTVRVVSDELAGLTLNEGDVGLTFVPSQTEYELNVANSISELSIAPILDDPAATVVVNGSPLADGISSISLNPGENEITIVVTAMGGAAKTYQLAVTRQQAAAPSATLPGTEARHADVDTGTADGTAVQVDIARSTGADGHILDSVVLDSAKADEVLKDAAANGGSVARIVVGDVPGNPADQIDVRVASAALSKMISADLGLVVQAGGAQIALAADTLSQIGEDGEDLYFRVVPVRKSDERSQVEQRVLDSQVVKSYAGGSGVQVVAQPMTIETNYAHHRTEVTLPLDGISLPADQKERDAYLRSLAVYVEHSDGEKVVENGTLVYDAAGQPVGLRIEVQKFSTFTVISANAAAADYAGYLAGYKDGKFRPEQGITRAELAAILARQLKLDPASAELENNYTDVPASNWASTAILELTTAGILSGDGHGKYRPNDVVTRAEIAAVLDRLKPMPDAGNTGFSDTKGHWASAAIASAKQAGLMNGYADGTFRPSQKLTRAEAVVLLNRLFNRPVLSEAASSSFSDVSASAWYSADVESAANDLRAYADGRVEKSGAKLADQK